MANRPPPPPDYAKKLLDLYIHDYLVKNNMQTAADIFVQEANIQLQPAAIDTPEGFLKEWWEIFWESYCNRLHNNRQETLDEGGSAAMPVQGIPDVAEPNVSNFEGLTEEMHLPQDSTTSIMAFGSEHLLHDEKSPADDATSSVFP